MDELKVMRTLEKTVLQITDMDMRGRVLDWLVSKYHDTNDIPTAKAVIDATCVGSK